METALNDSKNLIKECYADLIMIYVLGLKYEEYISILTKSFHKANEGVNTATNQHFHTQYMTNIDAVRAISGLMLTEVREPSTKSFEELLENLPIKVKEKKRNFKDDVGNDLFHSMQAILSRNADMSKASSVSWRILAPHLFKVGKTLKVLLPEATRKIINPTHAFEVINNNLLSIINQYNSVKGDKETQSQRLSVLFSETKDERKGSDIK